MSKADTTFHIDGGAFSAMREKAAYEPSEASYAELDYLTAAQMLERARSLAHSIIPVDEASLQIAYDALLGARLCRNKQKHHRKNWLDKNRYKRYGPTKALLHENQLVQEFVYRESEKYERYAEGERDRIDNPRIAGMLDEQPLTARDAAIRYLKHLIQNSHDNSANAVLAVAKLIYRYRTVDAAEIYTQLHSDGPAENYFSKRKGEFVRKLEDRFRLLIELGVMRTAVGARGERYFEGQDRYDSQWLELIEEYLKLFTPWGTDCPLQEKEESFIGSLFSRLEEIFSEDKRKMSCIHAILCPDCLRKLMKDMDLPDPRLRLALPMFYMEREGDGQMRKGAGGRSSESVKREADNLIEFLKREDARRVKASHSSLAKPSLSIDDSEKIPIDSINNESSRFSFNGTSSRLLKLFTRDSEGDLLLAALLIDPNEIKSSIEHKLFGRKEHLVWEGTEKICIGIEARGEEFTIDAQRRSNCGLIENITALIRNLRSEIRNPQSAIRNRKPVFAAILSICVFAIFYIGFFMSESLKTYEYADAGADMAVVQEIFIAPSGNARAQREIDSLLKENLAKENLNVSEQAASADALLKAVASVSDGRNVIKVLLMNRNGDVLLKKEFVNEEDPAEVANRVAVYLLEEKMRSKRQILRKNVKWF